MIIGPESEAGELGCGVPDLLSARAYVWLNVTTGLDLVWIWAVCGVRKRRGRSHGRDSCRPAYSCDQ